MNECTVDVYASRVCERGTKGCVIRHPEGDMDEDEGTMAKADLIARRRNEEEDLSMIGKCKDCGTPITVHTEMIAIPKCCFEMMVKKVNLLKKQVEAVKYQQTTDLKIIESQLDGLGNVIFKKGK